MGGYNIGGTFTKTYTDLPPHNIILYSISFYMLDNWKNNDKFKFTLGSFTYQYGGVKSSDTWTSPLCGGSSEDTGEVKFN